MKALVIGISHRKGIAKESGRPYDFAQVTTLEPLKEFESERYTCRGHGLDSAEIKADPSCLSQFAGMKFPAELELVTEARRSPFGQLELVVVGVKK